MTVPAQPGAPKATSERSESRATQTALYRFFGEDGELLYVGITKRLLTRWREHSRDYATTWWPMVRSNTVLWYPNRTEAGRAERYAIHTEKPLYNVMHTARNKVPQGTRASRESQTEQRGDSLLEVLIEHFPGRPFTTSDAIGVAKSSASGVQKNMNALVIRGLVVIVGARHAVTSGLPRRSSTLYSLPLNEWIDGETSEPLAPERIPSETPKPRDKRLPVPKQRTTIRKNTSAQRVVEKELTSPLPAVVTFTSGAALLKELGLVDSITRDGVRFISKSPDWPFGPGKTHQYGKAAGATTMDTTVFLEYFRSGPRRGGTGRRSSIELPAPSDTGSEVTS